MAEDDIPEEEIEEEEVEPELGDSDGPEDDEDEPEPKGEGDERLQPKQQNEQLCNSCFLLVKSSAPNCPVGDDDCPIFS